MNTNKVLCCMTFLVLFLATDLKGQRGIPALFPDTISFQNLSICNESIVPVLKCIDSCWACSSFSDIFSYATMTPHKDTTSGILWNITIEQLYDYSVFTVNMFPGFWCPFFANGLIVFNNLCSPVSDITFVFSPSQVDLMASASLLRFIPSTINFLLVFKSRSFLHFSWGFLHICPLLKRYMLC